MKKLSGGIIALIVAAVVIVALLIFGISTNNGLATSKLKVDQEASNIQTQLQRRSDLIPNLVNSVKGYMAHETEVINSVTEARAKLAGANTISDQSAAAGELNSALSRLLVVVENYPDLKADQNFRALTDELAGTENRITAARTKYNESVTDYNQKIVKFPSNIIAGMFGYEKADYFEADAGANEVPEVKFD